MLRAGMSVMGIMRVPVKIRGEAPGVLIWHKEDPLSPSILQAQDLAVSYVKVKCRSLDTSSQCHAAANYSSQDVLSIRDCGYL